LATEAAQQLRVDPLRSIFIRFLKFGLLAWGGPAAQIAMIKRECVDEEQWISEESFKKLLAVYQVLPGPEAHELCVYFGRLRGGKLGGFLAGLGFMLPGFILMLGLSILYVDADIAKHLDFLFYGLTAAVGALVARALVRLSGSFITDIPLAVLAVAGFALTLFASVSFVLVLLGGGLAYELWKNGSRWMRRANSPAISPATVGVIAAGTVTISLTAQIFLEGLKAGLLTFGGAYTVIPFLRDSAVSGHHWLTSGQFVDGLALSGILPAPLIIFSTFVGYLAGGIGGSLAMTFGIFIPAFVFPIFPAPPAGRGRRERAAAAVSARGSRRSDRTDRGGHGPDRQDKRCRRLHGHTRDRRVPGTHSLALETDGAVGRSGLRRHRRVAPGHNCLTPKARSRFARKADAPRTLAMLRRPDVAHRVVHAGATSWKRLHGTNISGSHSGLENR
jgi:chromate transporter